MDVQLSTRPGARRPATLASAVVLLLASLVAAVLSAAPAQAASAISSCFSYRGQRYQGLATFLEYYGTDDAWHALNGTEGSVNSNGCVSYNIAGTYRTWYFRIHAAGVVPAWRGFFNGVSAHYGPSGNDSWNLGETALSFYVIPASWSTPPRSEAHFDSWLAGMTDSGSRSTCQSSSAASVACYMDANGLVGNVVVQYRDSDGDGISDGYDRYPFNKYYR